MRVLHLQLIRATATVAVVALLAGGASAALAKSHPTKSHPTKSHSNHGKGHKGAKNHGNAGKGAHKRHATLYVSPSGSTGARDHNCHSAAFSTVQSAVDAASAGSTVIVCKGTYTEDVIISTPLTLSGRHGAVIQGSTTANGNCQQLGQSGAGSAPCLAGITIKSGHVKVQGLTVTGAQGEGILATGSLAGGSINDVVIQKNRVVGNDLGSSTSPYPQCDSAGMVPGDCGEGIHLMGVGNSIVKSNFDSNNSGGILLTDEFGPTHNNKIEHNNVTKNQSDCGITVPGHNPTALDSTGKPQPSMAGVYDNVISHNRVTDNGLLGDGAGVLFANATAGTASYDNLVEHNYIAGNGLAGVTMHAHTVGPGQFEDLNGNRIVHNTIGKNNIDGDGLDGGVSDQSTTGVLVFSATVPVQVDIAHNRIRDNDIGVWLGVSGNVTANMSHNVFQHVTTSVVTSP